MSEASRRCYGQPRAAEQYDRPHFLRAADLAVLDADLRRALDRLGHPASRRAAALDACGGTGNAALRLQALGCDTHRRRMPAPARPPARPNPVSHGGGGTAPARV